MRHPLKALSVLPFLAIGYSGPAHALDPLLPSSIVGIRFVEPPVSPTALNLNGNLLDPFTAGQQAIRRDHFVSFGQNSAGYFPIITDNSATGGSACTYTYGGLPQNLPDLNATCKQDPSAAGFKSATPFCSHLNKIALLIKSKIPENWAGFAMIDFESWSATWDRTNVLYHACSIELVKKDAEFMGTLSSIADAEKIRRIEYEAASRFEKAAATFLLRTLNWAKDARPMARWGYYGYPYRRPHAGYRYDSADACQAPTEVSQVNACDCGRLKATTRGGCYRTTNDRLAWLWRVSTALYPYTYQFKTPAPSATKTVPFSGVLADNSTELSQLFVESKRVAALQTTPPRIIPLTWHLAYTGTEPSLARDLLHPAYLNLQYQSARAKGATDIGLWGIETNSRDGADQTCLREYTASILEPLLRQRYKLEGQALDSKGLPVEGVTVECRECPTRTKTSSTGQYQFAGLKPGTYHIAIAGQTLGTPEIAVSIGYSNAASVNFTRTAGLEGQWNAAAQPLEEIRAQSSVEAIRSKCKVAN